MALQSKKFIFLWWMEGVSSIKIPEAIGTPRISVMQAIRQQNQTYTFFVDL